MKISNEEKEYLAAYSIEKYDRPSVATDIVTFAVISERMPSKSLSSC